MEIKLPELFVIAVIEDNEVSGYYDDRGECLEFNKSIKYAELFTDFKSVEIVFEQLVKASGVINPSSDGVLYPADSIRRALRLCDSKPRGIATIAIVKLAGEFVTSKDISGEIKKPTGYTYD